MSKKIKNHGHIKKLMQKIPVLPTERVDIKKIKKQDDEDIEAGAALFVFGAAIAGLGLWAWRRKKAQPLVGPAFALVPTNQGQGQRVSQGFLPRGDFEGPRRQGTDRSDFGFVF